MERAAQVLSDNRQFYQACAPQYDAGRQYFYLHEGRRIKADLEWLSAFIPLPGAVVMDVGCGTGLYGQHAALLGVGEVHCLDVDEVFLATATARILAANPQARVHRHQEDLGAFVAKRADLLSHIDIYLMGSVIQYVPGAAELLEQLAASPGRRGFYITSSRLPGGGRHPLVENIMARADYLLHRLVHAGTRGTPRRQEARGREKVTLSADPAGMLEALRERGFTARYYTYSSFHTALFNRVHQLLRQVFPSLGSFFTLLAVRGQDAQKEGKKWH